MDIIHQRRRHVLCRELQDIVVCCNHSNKVFIDNNGGLVDHSGLSFCRDRCNRSTKVYVFLCERCFKMFQEKSASLYAVNYARIKHYVDKRDIKSVQLNGLYRFCLLEETKSGAFFKISQLKIILH